MSPTFVFNHPITSEELPPSTRTSRPRWPGWTSCSWTRRPPEHRDELESKWNLYAMHHCSGLWLNPPTKGWKKLTILHLGPTNHGNQRAQAEVPDEDEGAQTYLRQYRCHVCSCNTRTEVYSNKPRLALSLPGSHITKTTTKSTDPLTLLWIMTQIQAQRWCIHPPSRPFHC